MYIPLVYPSLSGNANITWQLRHGVTGRQAHKDIHHANHYQSTS